MFSALGILDYLCAAASLILHEAVALAPVPGPQYPVLNYRPPLLSLTGLIINSVPDPGGTIKPMSKVRNWFRHLDDSLTDEDDCRLVLHTHNKKSLAVSDSWVNIELKIRNWKKTLVVLCLSETSPPHHETFKIQQGYHGDLFSKWLWYKEHHGKKDATERELQTTTSNLSW